MNNLMHWLAPYSENGMMFLLRWSWQALLLLAAALLLVKCYRSQTPSMRHQIWLYALIAVAILPLWALAVHWFPLAPSPSEAIAYIAQMPASVIASAPESVTQGASVSIRPDAFVTSFFVWCCLFVAWAVGALITFARLARSTVRLSRARMGAQQVKLSTLGCDGLDPSLLDGSNVAVGLSPVVHSPMLIGVLHPMILLPADIAAWTTAPERRAILQHELAHLQRRDHYINCLEVSLRVVFFFHPLVRYACHQLYVERELSCDGRVLSMGTAAAVYVESILKVAEHNFIPVEGYQPAFLASKQNLKRRIEMIMNQRPPSGVRRWPWLVPPLVLMSLMIWLLVPVSGQKVVHSSNIELPFSAQEQVDLPPPPPLTVPLPEEVTGLRRVVFLERDKNQILFTVGGQSASAEGNLKDVTVSIPGFTFKAGKARRGEDWIYLVDSFEIMHDGHRYYGSGSLLIRTISGGLVSDTDETTIECWLTSAGAIYTDPARAGKQLTFNDLPPK
jgi:beta-lactamase regulating signal transducer with metallopeptidase domain